MQTFSFLFFVVVLVCGVFSPAAAQYNQQNYQAMMSAIQAYLKNMDQGKLQDILSQYGARQVGPGPDKKPPTRYQAPAYLRNRPANPVPASNVPPDAPSSTPAPVYPSTAPKQPAAPATPVAPAAPKPPTPVAPAAPKPPATPAPTEPKPPASSGGGTYGSWTAGTATYYTTPDQGSCGYGPLPNGNVKTGTDIAAISSIAPNYGATNGYYKAKSCGLCYEVKCSKSPAPDGTGTMIDSKNYCYDKSIVVTITDTCPLDGNPKCGATHLDLNQKAFDKIA